MKTKKVRTKFKDKLQLMGACEDARNWCGDKTGQQAWDQCEDPSWMFWLLSHSMPPKASVAIRRKIVLLACDCAQPALQYVQKGEERPKAAIDLAERWGKGEKISVEDLYAVSAAASDASRTAYLASRAAYVASRDASDIASRDAYAASRAADAASRAASDVAYAAYVASRDASDIASRAADAASRAPSDAAYAASNLALAPSDIASRAAYLASRAASRVAQCKLIRQYFPKCPVV